ncbi:hypothetical protein ASZ90_005943 [hydrocarbon metagenome]|uniref:Uncharacterized protein n=1 Tax=hydrocarbon metagenome TaxID=938273 RepID=A0A0W8FTG5_9ZZZZ
MTKNNWLLKNAPGLRRASICGVYPGESRGCASALAVHVR